MLTICARLEQSQMDPDVEWRMWRQLRGAFKIDRFVFTPKIPYFDRINVESYFTMEEAVERCEGRLAFLERKGEQPLSFLRGYHRKDTVLVFGNTEDSNLKICRSINHATSFYIKTPGETDLYGINAAAIALASMVGQ